jgi:hypothetical protein
MNEKPLTIDEIEDLLQWRDLIPGSAAQHLYEDSYNRNSEPMFEKYGGYTQAQIANLSTDNDPKVRQFAATFSADPKVLKVLAQDQSSLVRLEVAKNPKTDIVTRSLLMLDQDERVRNALK